jgi:hypothetical protein
MKAESVPGWRGLYASVSKIICRGAILQESRLLEKAGEVTRTDDTTKVSVQLFHSEIALSAALPMETCANDTRAAPIPKRPESGVALTTLETVLSAPLLSTTVTQK